MNRRGLILKIFGVVFLVSALGAVAAGVYFYNFFVFKTLRICIGDEIQESEELNFSCSVDSDCTDYFKGKVIEQIELPEFAKEKLDEVADSAALCDEDICKARKIYGDIFDEDFSGLCEEGDKEILIEIRGKEGLEILKFLKKNADKN